MTVASMCLLACMAGPYEGENEVRCEGEFPIWWVRNSKPEIYQAGFKLIKVPLYARCEDGDNICQRRLSYTVGKKKSWEFDADFEAGAEKKGASVGGSMGAHYGEEEYEEQKYEAWQVPVGGPCPGADDPKILDAVKQERDCNRPDDGELVKEEGECVAVDEDGQEVECASHMAAIYLEHGRIYNHWARHTEVYVDGKWYSCNNRCESWVVLTQHTRTFTVDPQNKAGDYTPGLMGLVPFCTGSYKEAGDLAIHPEVEPTL